MQEQKNWFAANAGATEELLEGRSLPSQDKHAALRLVVFIFEVRESLLVLSHIQSSDKRLALELKRVMFRKIYGQELIDDVIAPDLKQLVRLRVELKWHLPEVKDFTQVARYWLILHPPVEPRQNQVENYLLVSQQPFFHVRSPT